MRHYKIMIKKLVEKVVFSLYIRKLHVIHCYLVQQIKIRNFIASGLGVVGPKC